MTYPVTLSVVVPVYRSEDCVLELVAQTCNQLRNIDLPSGFELVLVDDCSPDRSWERIVESSRRYPEVRGVSLMKNFGQHNASMAGLRESRGEFVVLMDDDLQHSPAEIPSILEKLTQGADVCYTRFHERKHELWKRFGSSVNNAVATMLLRKPHELYLSSYKGMRRCVVDVICKYDGPFTYLDGLILDVTRNVDAITIDHHARFAGRGNYSVAKSISLWLKMATSFSVLPLRFASIAGIGLGILAATAAVFIAFRVLIYGAPYPGWASVIVAVLIVGSLQLIGIGLVGEYIGRAYLRINSKPQYVIGKRIEAGPNPERLVGGLPTPTVRHRSDEHAIPHEE